MQGLYLFVYWYFYCFFLWNNCFFSVCLFLDNLIDLIEIADLWSEPHGVRKVYGRCINETNVKELDKSNWAYRLSQKAQISVSTQKVFPNGFPQDFSLMAIVKPQPGT